MRPQALVYRGPASSAGLPESVAHLLETSPRHFEVRYAGPNEALNVSAETLRGVDLYAQPGGPDVDNAWDEIKVFANPLRNFIASGGRYLGFCLGAYLAGRDPGLGIVPKKADVDSEIEQKNAQITDDKDSIIQIDWTWSAGEKAGQTTKNTWIYFQEGAVMQGFKPNDTTFVLGRYSRNGDVAATLNKFGNGWVGLIGPHPEATQDWFDEYGLPHPDGLQLDIGYDLIEATMAGGPQKQKQQPQHHPGVSSARLISLAVVLPVAFVAFALSLFFWKRKRRRSRRRDSKISERSNQSEAIEDSERGGGENTQSAALTSSHQQNSDTLYCKPGVAIHSLNNGKK